MPDDPVLKLRRMARQLVYRTGYQETPISLGGTYFLLEYQRRLFAITARHVVSNIDPEELLLAINDTSLVSARILRQFNPADEDSGDVDLVVYLLDIRHLIAKHRSQVQALELSTSDTDWLPLRYESTYFFFGFPLAHSSVDYGRNTTQALAQQHFFVAKYRGVSGLAHCHALQLVDTNGMGDLNGMSGSPVFAHQAAIGVATLPRFAGILLRGSATGGIVHFLNSQAIMTTLEEVLRQPTGRLPKRWPSVKTKKRRTPRNHT